MSIMLEDQLTLAREAIIASDPQGALEHIEAFAKAAEENPPENSDKEKLQSLVEELGQLAEAALNGAEVAIGRVQDIIRSASNLQIYNEAGERQETSIVARVPRRF